MCGKCDVVMGKAGCCSIALGAISTLLAVVSRLSAFAPMRLGPRSFAAGAALLFLLAIAIHTCQHSCANAGETPSE